MVLPHTSRTVLLVRHPQTVANAAGRFLGSNDSPWTAEGERQALELTARLRAWSPGVVYSSPSPRALRLAESIARPAAPSVLAGLAEIDFGELEGLTWIVASERGIAPVHEGNGPVAPGGERLDDFKARVAEAAETVTASARPVVVTHGGVIRQLLTLWLRISAEAAWHIALPHGCTVEITERDGWWQLESLTPSVLPLDSDTGR